MNLKLGKYHDYMIWRQSPEGIGRIDEMTARKVVCVSCDDQASELYFKKSAKQNDGELALCHLCFKAYYLDCYPINYEGKDKIIYFPDLSQSQLNILLKETKTLAKQGNSEQKQSAHLIFSELSSYGELLEQVCPEAGLSNPGLMAHYIHLFPKNPHLKACRLLVDVVAN